MTKKSLKKIGRRTILHDLGLATGLSASALSGLSFTSIAAAGGDKPRNDGSSITVGEDQVMSAPYGGGLTDYEWNSTRDEQDSQHYDLVIDQHSNPGDPPFDVCVPLHNGNDLCVKTADQYMKGSRVCGSSSTPELYSVDVTAAEFESGSVRGEFTIWIGVDNYGCLWVGQEDLAICGGPLVCDMASKYQSISESPGPWVDAMQAAIDWVEENPEVVVGGLTLLALAVIAIFLAPEVAAALALAGAI